MARSLKVVLDVETTGRGHVIGREDGVVQIAFAYRDPNLGNVVTWSATCNPGEQYYCDGRADGAFKINGMTEARLARAPTTKEVAAELRSHLENLRVRHGPLDLRAYNLAFDRPFLAAEPWNLADAWGPCLMLEAQRMLTPSAKWPKLVEACAMLGIMFPGSAHEAASDAHAALLVHEALNALASKLQPPLAKP